MAQQHDKETDPITSGNRMTNDEIAGRDESNTEKPKAKQDTDKNDDSKEESTDTQEQSEDVSDENPSTDEEAPDLSHASDVTPSDDDNQER
ncbi:hypothetical protein [Exiguobacterium undae]|uniref:TSPY-like 2 n=1 Tax=Exiguobacterium undae TaxID=169177 RepID=A0ABX2VC70_9BACL|nr:hypothetical protein [Exiguobacterium undae]OAN15817.1 hypothetical protein A3783_07750 [Exiguobacterium undae]